MEKQYEQIEGHVESNPYLNCHINGHHFKCRIDTGADISVIPEDVIPIESSCGKRVTINGHKGIPEKIWTKKVKIDIDELGTFAPERGVLSRKGITGLIGMDIIRQCELHMVGNVFILNLLKESK